MAEPPVCSITSEWYKFDERVCPELTDNPFTTVLLHWWELFSLCSRWARLRPFIRPLVVCLPNQDYLVPFGPTPFPFLDFLLPHPLAVTLSSSILNLTGYVPGQYHWVHCLTPASYRATASWFTGWISIGGQLVLAASAAFAAGLQLQALITLNNPDSYIPARWQGMLFYWLIIAYSTAINIWGSKILPHTNTAAGRRTSHRDGVDKM